MGTPNDPLPVEDIEAIARERLLADPIVDAQGGAVAVDALLEELAVLEDAAEESYAEGHISAAWRNGILSAVVGLRLALEE